ncbi:hypothetical protein CBR_g31946 [Chara braunii]|uniref:tRNA-intron lyase n=1 Tax=Chara braunii TaxID=69332 RepID=A0A388LGG2_CHABU|nr:hypothetical protein CBR_g31946 [Chara braunii]|eukprot:GBG81272.1 hypothetical protein CBR_g31946 [Chara braunii]
MWHLRVGERGCWIDLGHVAQPSNTVAQQHADRDNDAPLMGEKYGNDGCEVQEGCTATAATLKGTEVCSRESVADLVDDREKIGEGKQDGCTMGAPRGAEVLRQEGVVDLRDERESGSGGEQRVIDQVAAGLGVLRIDDRFACSHGGKDGSRVEKKGGSGTVKEEEEEEELEGWEELVQGKKKGAVVIPLATSSTEIQYASRRKLHVPQAVAGWTYPRTAVQAQRCDPSKFHSAFAVRVIDSEDTLMPLGLIGAARVALTARKRLVLAFVARKPEGNTCLNKDKKNNPGILGVETNAANTLMVDVPFKEGDDTAKEQSELGLAATLSDKGEAFSEKCEIRCAAPAKECDVVESGAELSPQGHGLVLCKPSSPMSSALQRHTHTREGDDGVDVTEGGFNAKGGVSSPRTTTDIESDALCVPAGKPCRMTCPHQIHQRGDDSQHRTPVIGLDDDGTCCRSNDVNLGFSHKQQWSSDLDRRGSRPSIQTAERADVEEPEWHRKRQVVEDTLQNRSRSAASAVLPDEQRPASRDWACWIGKVQYITVSPDLNFVVLNFRPTKVIRDQEKASASLAQGGVVSTMKGLVRK